MAEHSFTILSLKKFRNDAARVEGESELGRDFGVFLPSRVTSEYQHLLHNWIFSRDGMILLHNSKNVLLQLSVFLLFSLGSEH